MRCFFFALLLAVPTIGAAPQDKAEWTILIYMSADCNLEESAIEDIVEMEMAKQDDRVRVVVQCDRAEKDKPKGEYSGAKLGDLGNFKTTKRLLIGKGHVQELAELGETNTGDPKALADFIAWGVKKFPANRTALILWDHGAGWQGFGGDDSHKGDQLNLEEMGAALEQGRKAAGIGRFDVIGFDCCCMASLEVMRVCAPHGKIFVASEDLEPGYGWDYTAWLSKLVDKPRMEPGALGRVICDTFKNFFDKNKEKKIRKEGHKITLCVVDLDRIAGVVEATGLVSDALRTAMKEKGRDAWKPVARARQGAEEYPPGEDSFFLHDLHHLARNLKGCGADEPAATLARAVEEAVLYRINGKLRPQARGISIYFPPEKDKHEEITKSCDTDLPRISCSEKWTGFVHSYLGIQTQDTKPPVITKPTAKDKKLEENEKTNVTAKVDADDIAEAYFVLAVQDEKTHIILGMLPVDLAEETLDEEFDGTWLAIGDEENQLLAPITSFEEVDDKEGVYLVGIPVLYQAPGGGEWQELTLYFEVDWNEDDFTGDYVIAFKSTSQGPTAVDIDAGGKIKPRYVVVTEEGEEELRPVEDADVLTVGEEGLDIVEEDLEDGKYLVGFLVVDLAGNVADSLVEIEIDEEK